MNCGELLMRMLADHGIDTAFGIPGTHTIELYRGLRDGGIRHISPRHEQGAGFMADGYARVTGRPAVCLTVSGPGALNIATAMGQALQDSVPMLVISADNQRHERGLGEGRLHETRNLQAAMAEASVWSHTLMRPDELPKVLARAFTILHSERPGPVHLALPLDVITAEAGHVDARAWPLAQRPVAPEAQIDEAARRLNRAERPVVALGGGAADAAALARDVAEALDAPVTLTHNARGILPPDHPLLVATSPSFQAVRELYLEADLILGVGTEFSETDYDFFFDGGFALGGELVRIDIDPAQLCRNARPDLAIRADSAAALSALLPRLERRERGGAARTNAVLSAVRGHDPHYQRFLDTLESALPGAVLVADSTQPAYYAAAQYHPPAPRSFASAATGYGTLGYALPAACGARLARPDRPVIALLGDGGLQFTLPELASAVEAQLGLAVVVWNNTRYDMIARNFEDAGMAPIACDIYTPDLLAIARGYGCAAERARNHQELERLLREANARQVPTLIEVREGDFLPGSGPQ
ncbi:5-guanidino-2-oxopentanoate decarboxylase [Parahaliea mediterranea]|uniref:5-guanidino-2-oxopentanoate decarboxylase n=1 Tax=Parahaliea mediterranea TaxID=651086 RepID=A0A939DFE5_9GAMM|nr:5-guanidino-2-oxopentanoate decarboxylase [Parahaliea mediterranea]MBN7796886.1 5-guanidino-2-oxopentanoate decarboxylase [Parahaliea mediterranea]